MTPVPTWVDIRRSGALVLALTMMLLLLAVPATAQQNVESAPVEGLCPSGAVVLQYDDAEEISQVHRAAVDCLTDMEVVHGRTAPDGEGQVYRPDEPVERDQMASFIIRGLEAAGYELPPGDATFDDVTDANVHADTIRTLAAIEVTTGVTADRYAPDEPVTRAQMATFLLRALAFAEELSIEAVTVDEPAFDDTEGLFHQPFIAGAEQQGIVEGVTDDRYEPAERVSREQMAAFVARLLDTVFDIVPRGCSNTEAGYVIDFPDWWSTNEGDVVADCSVFDPAPFELTEGTEIPLELAIRILESPLSFEEATEPGENEEFRSGTEETTVAGLDALRIIAESTGGPTTLEGTTIYRYVIDVPGEGVLIAATYDVEGNRFRLANEVLDAMMDTFELQQ